MSGFAINQFTVSGNLTRDPELRHTNSGTAVCNLRIANNTSRKDASTGEYIDKPNFFDVTVWKGMGEWIAQNLSKGDTVVVSGRVEWREYQDGNGNKRQAYDVIADSIVPVGGQSNGRAQSDVPADDAFDQPPAARQQVEKASAPPGTVADTPENRDLYCICPPGQPMDGCPIQEHGIPFRRLAVPDFETRRRDLFVGDRWLA